MSNFSRPYFLLDYRPCHVYYRVNTLARVFPARQLISFTEPPHHQANPIMLFSIDVDSDVAIYEQIVHQVQFAVAGGVLVGGQMVPSVRQLANQLAINPNTIARAYQELQAQQVLQPLRGRGLVVRNDAVTRCTQTRNRILQQGIDAAIATAVHSGLAHEDIRQMVTDSMQQQFQTATSVADNMNDKATGNGAASES